MRLIALCGQSIITDKLSFKINNLIKGGVSGRTAKGGRAHTRAVKGIDGDVKLNRALWVMAEKMLQLAS